MTARDHNKTIALVNAFLGVYFLLPFLPAPWILAKNIDAYPSPRRADQIMIALVVSAVLIFFSALFLSTAYGLSRRRRWARRLALVAACVQLFIMPPLAIYTWWFMHGSAARAIYGGGRDEPPG
jgi:protein-S-isoprenylcysteine O-methyltransferase Ste14